MPKLPLLVIFNKLSIEKNVKIQFNNNKKHTKTIPCPARKCTLENRNKNFKLFFSMLYYMCSKLTSFSRVSIFDSEQVNVRWEEIT